MIGNTLTSFFDNLATRSKNPFLGTFAIVWFCRNWELVFALFNFDKSFKLQDKINFLSDRVQYDTFWPELGANIGWTFLILIITYALINVARAITNLFEKKLTPLIYKWTDYGSLVPKFDYQGILSRMENLQDRLDKEIQERVKVQNEKDELEIKLGKVTELNVELNRLKSELNEANARFEKIEEREKNVELDKGFAMIKKPVENIEINEVESKFLSLINDYGLDHLNHLGNLILEESGLDYNKEYEIIDFLISHELILLKAKGKREFNKYRFTEAGRELFGKYLD
jgi:Skp family chaperone for outer membrane proteins